MEELFINEKPVKALITLRRNREMYCSKISREVDTTYAHTVRILSRLEEESLIETRKEGRKKFIKLTSEGEKYAEKFQQLLELSEEGQTGLEEGMNRESLERDMEEA